MQLIAKTFHGLEQVLAAELQGLGAGQIEPLRRAVSFEGDLRLLYRANYELRTALRILMPIHSFQCQNEDQLYQGIYQEIDWSAHLNTADTLAVNAVVHSDFFTHSKYVALKTKDAIVDQFRDKFGRRPSVDVDKPNVRINIHLTGSKCNVSLDSSGESLHLRGYRTASVEAPINEVLAAGLLRIAGWPRPAPLIDPMCGSGTFLIEAAGIATNSPAQRNRPDFGFQRWKNFDAALWQNIRREAQKASIDWPYPLYGFDHDNRAIRAALTNMRNSKVKAEVQFEQADFLKSSPPTEEGILILNPPYDERLVKTSIEEFYQEIGDQLKTQYPGFEAWIISSNMEALKKIGLRSSQKETVFNGPLECKYQKFELYAGSKKQKDS